MAVSYTHLLNNWYGNDVSAVVSAIRKDPQNRTNSIIICEMKGDVSVGDSYTPVSYTHLDVYKRQTFKFTLNGYLGLMEAVLYDNQLENVKKVPNKLPIFIVSGQDLSLIHIYPCSRKRTSRIYGERCSCWLPNG